MRNRVMNLACLTIFHLLYSVVFAQKDKPGGISGKTPCMDVIDRFTQPGVPSMAPEEVFAPLINSTEKPPANLPGKGLAQHPMLYIGENCNRMSLVNGGQVIWTYSTGIGPEYDDIWMLSNGNILFTRMQYIAEITPDKKIVWRYDCNSTKGPEYSEVHTCQPIGLDKVMFVLNSLRPKLMIVNTKTGRIEVEHEIPYDQPADPKDVHAQFRRVRVTANGTYLVSYLLKDRVVEYDKNFKEVWRYSISSPWASIRLKNGNTLITSEKEWLTREVNRRGETVWEFNCKTDLPAHFQFTSAPQSCTRLVNGNTIFTSRGKQGTGPQLIEVTRDKKIVWVLHEWQKLGDASAVQILDDPGFPEIPGQSEH
jgi:hypothetical protein